MERSVVVYERVSTDRQDLSRQAVQRERARADHPEAELVVLQDDGVSAYKVPIFERPGGRELCELIATGAVGSVYVDAQDRLSRGADDEWVAFRALCDANDTWIVVDGQRITRDLGGKAISYLRALLARQESEEKAHRTRSGLREAARQGRYPVGAPPYGYRSVGSKRDRRFLVEPAEAAVVRRIFGEYVAGVGVNRIAARLNEDGIRTRRGSTFTARSILAVLPNRTYLGEVCLKGETLATGAHEPIIDAETFAQAERLRAAKRSRPNGGRGRPAKRHLLDGLLYCPNGHRMLARRRGKNEYYVCSRRHTYGDCDAPTASRRRVDETLLHHFLIRHFDEDEMRDRLRATADEKIEEARALAAQADREEQEAVAALARIRRDYVAGRIGADDWNELRSELDEAQAASRAKAAQLRGRATEIQAEAARVDVEAQLVARLATLMSAVRGNADDPEVIAEQRAALAATFERIVYLPAWGAAPEGAPIVCGEAELAPVLRPDLLAGAQSAAHGGVRSYVHAATPAGGQIAPHTMLRLLAGAVGEPDDRERRLLARAQVGLDVDATRLEANERERNRAAEHTSTVRPDKSRDCAALAPRKKRQRNGEPSKAEGRFIRPGGQPRRALPRAEEGGPRGKHGFPRAQLVGETWFPPPRQPV